MGKRGVTHQNHWKLLYREYGCIRSIRSNIDYASKRAWFSKWYMTGARTGFVSAVISNSNKNNKNENKKNHSSRNIRGCNNDLLRGCNGTEYRINDRPKCRAQVAEALPRHYASRRWGGHPLRRLIPWFFWFLIPWFLDFPTRNKNGKQKNFSPCM